MMVLISYDVKTEKPEGRRRLRRIAKICEDYGQRVQFSVFECDVNTALWIKIKSKLLNEMDPKEDSLRFYFLGNNYLNRIEHVGAKKVMDPEGPLIV